MNKMINKNAAAKMKTVEIPEAELTLLKVSVATLAEMHLNLISLYEKESHLKKHHKAYLHVRDHADQVCAEDKEKVNALLQHLMTGDTDDEADDGDRLFDPDWCAGCESYEECSKEAGGAEADEASELDVFALPEGTVFMSTDTLGAMQDDMLALTGTVDHLVATYRSMICGNGVDMKEMVSMLENASGLSQDVFKRWDDAEMLELA